MKNSGILTLGALALTFAMAPAFAAPQQKPGAKAASTPDQQGVQITSQVQGTVSGLGTVNLTFNGTAAHTRSGQTVLFTVKQLEAVNPGTLGPLSLSLDSQRQSTGTLSSATFPAVHRQNFFLRIKSNTLGTLISDLPLTLSATIQSSPPTATYKSVTGNVAFYREGDPNKQTVLTVQSVTSSVKPAASQAVNVTSRVRASVGSTTANLQFVGTASHLLSGRNVLFITKDLTAVDPGPLGQTRVILDSRQSSAGTLGSETFPTTHTQNFFLEIQSQNLGTLVADEPVVLSATISSTPPRATYRLSGRTVSFYRKGDPTKATVLTIQSVESDVTPPSGQAGQTSGR